MDDVYVTLNNIFEHYKEYILFVVGALISSAIGYCFSKKRENSILKMNIKVSTADKIFQLTEDFTRKSSYLTSFSLYNFTMYNSIVNDKLYSFEIKKSLLKTESQRLSIQSNDFESIFKSYGECVVQIILLMESREVVLSELVPLRNRLHECLMAVNKQWNIVYEITYDKSWEMLVNEFQVEESYIENIETQRRELVRLCVEVIAIVKDIEIKVQNDFLGSLFNYKVPIRVDVDNDKSNEIYVKRNANS